MLILLAENRRHRQFSLLKQDGVINLDWPELIGFVGGFLTTMGMIPQVLRLFRLKSAHEISLIFSLLFVLGITCWLSYGIVRGLMSVIVWNAVSLALGCAMLYAKFKWGRR